MKQSNDRYLKQLRARYNRATKKEKTVILDEYVKTTGRNRTYASALLSGRRRADQPICRPRRTIYGDEDRQVLLMLSDLFDGICSRRLRAAMDVELPGLVQSGALQVSPACYQDLLNRLYALLHDYTNSFLPVAKLHSKTRDGSRVTRTYDKPQT
ncbi:MAG: hypothetical protein GX601_05705, partial [Anaerolineales bacterium]|nr:hypothetical protein [Anaerolineales bacterium]